MRRFLRLAAIAVAALGATASARAEPRLPPGAIRSPHVRTTMDTNPANLASAVITHAFGRLPAYIDGARFRLLPFDPFRPATPGETTVRSYRLTVPRTSLVVDTAMSSAVTEALAREDSAGYRIGVSLDGAAVPQPRAYWVFYRNNGPLVCRIYFPGDLGSLSMGVHSLVLRPLTAGRHSLDIVVHRRIAGADEATLVTRYSLRVLARGPSASERASAPDDDANPASLGNTPLTFRAPTR